MKYKGKTIHKTKNADTWYTRYRVNGKQYYISAKSQIECYKKLKEAMKYENLALLCTPAIEKTAQTITLEEWYKKWLELYKIGQVKQTTIKDYEKTLKYVNNDILQAKLQDIKIINIVEMLNEIKLERTRQKVYELLFMLFEKAYKTEILSKNIMINIDKPKHEKENSQPLTREQEEKFVNVCKTHKYGDYFLTCLYQGFRKGECLGITNEDIDFINKTITINKSINANNQIDTTKNKQSMRTTPLFDKTLEILNKYKDKQGRIFDFSPKTQRLALKEINEQINYHIKTKDLRSTFITRCHEIGVPEFIIQTWVGHKIGSKVTSSVYTKYNAQDNLKFIDIVNKSKFYSNSTQKSK